MADPVSLEIEKGEQICIVGDNAAGKTRLIEILTGHYPLLKNEVSYDFAPSLLKSPSENIKYVAFRDSYGQQDSNYYYQQRWNLHDISDDMPTAGQFLLESYRRADATTERDLGPREWQQELSQRNNLRILLSKLFALERMEMKHIISLSSGELRKLQLARVLGAHPRLLILDEPFIGLDATTRDNLRSLLASLVRESGLQLILVLSRRSEIPNFITHVVPVVGLKVLSKVDRKTFEESIQGPIFSCPSSARTTESTPCSSSASFPPLEVLRFSDVTIRYANRVILNHLSWTVRQGEHWALTGPNGSGKSTLLSLVCADNPQAYACHIEMFGHRRGIGQSIWEIKQYIGYVCPEMHRAYQCNIPAIDVVASGLHDSVGLFVRPRPDQRQTCIAWMRALGIEGLADRPFLRISSGEQRLCLLARAFVKDPLLLVLDEPYHGLDDCRRNIVSRLIEKYCSRPHTSLIMVSHYEEDFPSCITNRLHLEPPMNE